MTYYRKLTALSVLLAVVALVTMFAAEAGADPLPGQQLKFSQVPMVKTSIDLVEYNGHDELSMMLGISAFGGPDPGPGFISSDYDGLEVMADDFADPFNTPVVHVKWWGSYLGNSIDPNRPIDRFLIAFESDLPADQNPFGFSRPDELLSSQIVDRGALGPGSGTFTETLIFSEPGGEDIYEYNAELHLDKQFDQDPNTVYWLKIAALLELTDEDGSGFVDGFDLSLLLAEGPFWGWHNRDYTVPDPFALAVTPPISPGERDEAAELGLPYPTEVWHFQDDAVSNSDTTMTLDPAMPNMPLDVVQNPFAYLPQSYVDGLDGPPAGIGTDGTTHVGISQFSKDLAFELFTIPEPATCMLMLIGLVAVAKGTRRQRG